MYTGITAQAVIEHITHIGDNISGSMIQLFDKNKLGEQIEKSKGKIIGQSSRCRTAHDRNKCPK